MAVTANTQETYNNNVIREDLHEALTSISPTATPFMSAIGEAGIDNTTFEWGEVDLAAPDSSNRVVEGDVDLPNDAPTNAKRLSNIAQLSDKVASVSSTSEAVSSVGNTSKMAKQIAYKLKELKRDMETMLVGSNTAASTGASGTARATASLSGFLSSNVDRGTGGANPVLSGTTEGYPTTAATDGTLRAITEDMLAGVIASCWDNGAEPSMVLCGSTVKRKISNTFTGVSTQYRMADDKTGGGAIDLYVSDFGELNIVPSRFVRSRDVFVLDPDYASVAYLQKTKQKPLATTGHSERNMISAEYGLKVDSEKAHGVIADIDGTL